MTLRIYNWWDSSEEKPTWLRVTYWKSGSIFLEGDTFQLVICNIEFQLQLNNKVTDEATIRVVGSPEFIESLGKLKKSTRGGK